MLTEPSASGSIVDLPDGNGNSLSGLGLESKPPENKLPSTVGNPLIGTGFGVSQSKE